MPSRSTDLLDLRGDLDRLGDERTLGTSSGRTVRTWAMQGGQALPPPSDIFALLPFGNQ